jgi:pimeloyl-ACP methyl ester carboxylesterase
MGEITHRLIKTNGITIHIAEQGSGPAVVLLHGFPELWYSWRHQLPALAEAGFHAIALDMRGYGESEAPVGIENYTSFHVVGDIIGVLDALGEKQEPGRAERDFASIGTTSALKNIIGSGANLKLNQVIAPKGKELSAALPVVKKLPPWLTEDDIKYYSKHFDKTGFTGPINYYRNLHRNWELTAPWTNTPIHTKVLFIAGKDDLMLDLPGSMAFVTSPAFREAVPNLQEVIILDGSHFIHEEQPQRFNHELISFLTGLKSDV